MDVSSEPRPWEHQNRDDQQRALAGFMPRDEYLESRECLATELVDLFGLDATKRGFEIGSGEGIVARELSPHCAILDCTDISRTFLEWARETCQSCKNVRFHLINQGYLDFLPEQVYDFGFSANVFIHFDLYRIYYYLQSVRRRLKSGGRFFFTGATLGEKTLDLFRIFADEYAKTHEVHHGFMQWNDLESLRFVIAEAGLDLLEEKSENFGGHLRILVQRP